MARIRAANEFGPIVAWTSYFRSATRLTSSTARLLVIAGKMVDRDDDRLIELPMAVAIERFAFVHVWHARTHDIALHA